MILEKILLPACERLKDYASLALRIYRYSYFGPLRCCRFFRVTPWVEAYPTHSFGCVPTPSADLSLDSEDRMHNDPVNDIRE